MSEPVNDDYKCKFCGVPAYTKKRLSIHLSLRHRDEQLALVEPVNDEIEQEQIFRNRSMGMTTKMVNDFNTVCALGNPLRYETKHWIAIDRKSFEHLITSQTKKARIDELKTLRSKYVTSEDDGLFWYEDIIYKRLSELEGEL